MLTLLFVICMLGIFGKLIGLAFKMTWGIAKVLFTLVFLPVILVGLAMGGLLVVAFPLLIVGGIVSLAVGLLKG